MILVTLGTQDKSFVRLMREIEKLIKEGVIKDKVIAQVGFTEFESSLIEVFDYLSVYKFNELVKSCDLLITHGGVGSIMEGIKNEKKVIAVPRLKRYKEHGNNHQVEIVNSLNESGNIIGINKVSLLSEAYKKVSKFVPVKYKSNNDKFVNVIREKIDSFK